MRTTGLTLSIVTFLAAIVLLAVHAEPVDAYDRWSINDDATNCGECHGDFRSNTYISPVDGMLWGNLHNIHRTTMLNGDCETCHLASDEFPVLLNESEGGTGFDPISCTGCHNGPGLRLHHIELPACPLTPTATPVRVRAATPAIRLPRLRASSLPTTSLPTPPIPTSPRIPAIRRPIFQRISLD